MSFGASRIIMCPMPSKCFSSTSENPATNCAVALGGVILSSLPTITVTGHSILAAPSPAS